jgi:hypothetical protein
MVVQRILTSRRGDEVTFISSSLRCNSLVVQLTRNLLLVTRSEEGRVHDMHKRDDAVW